MKRSVAAIFLFSVIAIMVFDSRIHFSIDLLEAKKEVQSPQRHWNLFYTQQHVYNDASFRYLEDFAKLNERMIPGQLMLADRASSYYSAAELPVFVPNIHAHHKRSALPAWKLFLDSRHACNLGQAGRFLKFQEFIVRWQRGVEGSRMPFTYVLVNKDQINSNLRLDCLSQTRRAMIRQLASIASIEFDGDYLRLYKLNHDSIIARLSEK